MILRPSPKVKQKKNNYNIANEELSKSSYNLSEDLSSLSKESSSNSKETNSSNSNSSSSFYTKQKRYRKDSKCENGILMKILK